MSDTNPGAAGWQPDPTGKHDHRYWDGTQWTENVSDAGVASTDPYVDPAATAGAPDAPLGPGSTDPTSVQPTVPDPAVGAGGPPPPAAMAPSPISGDGDGGGSKKGLLIGGAILVVVAIIVAVLALSGGDDDGDDELEAKLMAALTADGQGGLSEDDAECVSEHLMANVDRDVLEGLDFDAAEAPDEIEDDFIEAVVDCNVSAPGSDDDDPTTTTDDDDGTTTTGDDLGDVPIGEIPEMVRQQMVQAMMQAGLDEDQAECVVDNMVDAIEEGDIGEEDIFTRYQEFFEGCDVSPEDLGGFGN